MKTVRELIAVLATMPPDAAVAVSPYDPDVGDDSYPDVRTPTHTPIIRVDDDVPLVLIRFDVLPFLGDEDWHSSHVQTGRMH